MGQADNAGCRKCRYYLQVSTGCLKENHAGEMMRKGLAGMCGEFKEFQYCHHEDNKEIKKS